MKKTSGTEHFCRDCVWWDRRPHQHVILSHRRSRISFSTPEISEDHKQQIIKHSRRTYLARTGKKIHRILDIWEDGMKVVLGQNPPDYLTWLQVASIRLGRIPFMPPFRLRCCRGKGRGVQVLREKLHLTELKQRTQLFIEEPREQRFRIL